VLRCSILLALLLGACATAAPAPEFDPRTLAVWEFLRAKYDHDGDGRVERGEYGRDEQAFFHLDADRDGLVTRLDFALQWDGRPRTADGSFVWGEGGPEVGEAAPAFALPDLEGRERALSELCAERPVVLVFGSYT
jgi:hypothetical protein